MLLLRAWAENLCADAIGKMLTGAYADYLLVPAHIVARNAFHKPDALPFEEAALLEPLACVSMRRSWRVRNHSRAC